MERRVEEQRCKEERADEAGGGDNTGIMGQQRKEEV